MQKEPFIYGIRPVMEAIKSGKEIEKLLIQKGLRGEGFHQLHSYIREFEIPFQFVPVEKLNRTTRQNHQGIIAYLSEISYQKLEYIIPFIYEQGKSPLILVLDRITDVRNLGALARSAECAGVDALIVPVKGSAQINADAIKTSAGALNKIPVCRVNTLTDTGKYLRESGFQLIAATEKAGEIIYNADFSRPSAIILGAEDTGIDPKLLKMADMLVRIPLFGSIQSLNVSVAASVIFFEVVRQRNFQNHHPDGVS